MGPAHTLRHTEGINALFKPFLEFAPPSAGYQDSQFDYLNARAEGGLLHFTKNSKSAGFDFFLQLGDFLDELFWAAGQVCAGSGG